MNIKGQGNSLTFVQSYSYSTVSNFFSLKTAGPIETKFHVKPSLDEETNVGSNGLSHMTKMAALPIYGHAKHMLLENCTRGTPQT